MSVARFCSATISMLIGHCLRQMVREDREKFSTADRDADDRLSADEYRAFYHPWMQPYMHEYEVTRTLRELDTDNDSRIDLAEFIASAGSVPHRPSSSTPRNTATIVQHTEKHSENRHSAHLETQ